MDKKIVFNSNDDLYLGNLIKAKNTAIDNGYNFFLFNEKIYFIDEEGNTYNTKLKKDNLV